MIYSEEVHLRRHFGVKKVDNQVLRKIKNSGATKSDMKVKSKKKLIGLASYDILENHDY